MTGYHDIQAISRSLLEVARGSLARAERMWRGEDVVHATPAMTLGSALHCAVLEPGEYDARYVVAPSVDRRTRAGRAAWDDFLAEAGEREVLTIDQAAAVTMMSSAILRDRRCLRLIAESERELEIYWTRDEIACKARLDAVDRESGIVVDVKTTADPSPAAFARQCARHGYYRQAAWYMDAYRAEYGEDAEAYVLIAVRSAEPWEVGVYQLAPADIQTGRVMYDRVWERVRDAVETGRWADEWQRETMLLAMPGWVGTEDAWS